LQRASEHLDFASFLVYTGGEVKKTLWAVPLVMEQISEV